MSQGTKKQTSGRKRAFIAGGSVLGIAALATAAAFTDWALLDLNGSGGFGGKENAYNIVVSAGQESSVDTVNTWVEANPDAETVAPIVGAEALIPGGDPLYVNLPVLNESVSMKSTLSFVLENTTVEDPANAAENAAYAELMRFEVAQVDDASTLPGSWVTVSPVSFGADGKTPTVTLSNLDPEAGSVIVLKVSLVEGANQEATNAANGGTTSVQARFDGSSID